MLFDKARVVRFVPDQMGKGGAKTQVHSHQAGPLLDTYDVFNASVFYGRWRKESAAYDLSPALTRDLGLSQATATMGLNVFTWVSGMKWDTSQIGMTVIITGGSNTLTTTIASVGGGSITPFTFDNTLLQTAAVWPHASGSVTVTVMNALTSLVLHPFYRFSTTDAAADATISILGHNVIETLVGDLQHRIWDYSAGVLRKGTDQPCIPATFLNIKNRCHICWGGTDNFIFNGTTVYDSGVDAPATAPLYAIDPSKLVIAAATVTQGGDWITENVPPPTPGDFDDVPIPGFVTIGDQNYGTIDYDSVDIPAGGVATGTSGTNQLLLTGSVLAPNRYNGCYITTTGGVNTDIQIAEYFTPTATSNTVITLRSNLAATGAPFATCRIKGYQLQLNTTVAQPTAWSMSVSGHTGDLSWIGIGPRYAYAYYDPITGHISNMSPYVQVTEPDQDDVDIILSSITTTGDARFTKIKIFRTILAANGTILLQLTGGAGQPPDLNNTGGPLTFTDNYPDSTLLNAGTLVGPYLTNNPPPPFCHMVYWDGRIYGSPVDDPSAIRYSADNVQVTFGIPEESFPTRNVLRIPAADGRITGMKLIGNQAVVMTERWAYTIVGSNETNYRLIRYSTHMMGVGDYQVSTFAGDTSEDSDAVVYVGKDQKLYIMAPGIGNQPLSAPVQNLFATAIPTLATYKTSRVHTTTIEGRKLIVVRLPGECLLFDYDRRVWTRVRSNTAGGTQLVPECFASLYGSDSPVDELWAYQGIVRGWQSYNSVTALNSGFLKTFPLAFVDDEKRFKQLNFIRIYVVGSGTFTGSVWVDEANPATTPFVVNYDPVLNIYPAGASPIEGATRELYWFPFGSSTPSPQTYGGTFVLAPLQGYRFLTQVNFPSDTNPSEILAVDFCYSDVQEQAGVSL